MHFANCVALSAVFVHYFTWKFETVLLPMLGLLLICS